MLTKPEPGMLVADRFTLVRSLGSGRMAELYAGRDRETKGKVLIKLLHEQLCAVEESVRRFARECAVTTKIHHANTAKVIEFGQQKTGPLTGRHYLIMEMVGGKGLDEVLKNGAMPPERAVKIAGEIASALAAAHEQGVVHRDVSPGNVVLQRKRGEGEIAKVLDFGLARLEQDNGDELTDIGVRLGTALYMSPEYIERCSLDHRSDIYSLGVLLFHMLTGTTPYVGGSMRVMQDHVSAAIPRPGDKQLGIPGWLEELVISMMAKDPDSRPQTAAEVASTLQSHAADLHATAQEEKRAIQNASREVARPPVAQTSSVLHVSKPANSTGPTYSKNPATTPNTPLPFVLVLGALAALMFVVVFALALLVILL